VNTGGVYQVTVCDGRFVLSSSGKKFCANKEWFPEKQRFFTGGRKGEHGKAATKKLGVSESQRFCVRGEKKIPAPRFPGGTRSLVVFQRGSILGQEKT